MSSHEDEFSSFLDRLEEGQIAEADFDAITERYFEFLEAYGLDTELPEVQIEIKIVASRKMMVEEVTISSPDNPYLDTVKKELQAHYVLRDADLAWLVLIDQEFPGEPLTENDADIVEEVRAKEQEQMDELDIKWRATKSAMAEHLVGRSEVEKTLLELEEEELDVLLAMIFMHNDPRPKPQDKFESARRVLMQHGLYHEPKWNSLLNEFFPTGDTQN